MPTTPFSRRGVAAVLAACLLAPPALHSAESDAPRVPVIDDLLALRTVGGASISPDGRWVAFTVTESDFEQDAFVTQIWVAPVEGGEPYQLTRGPKSSGSPAWSPDSRWIAFTSSRAGDRSQIFAIRPDGGEAVQLTKAETGVVGFEWSPDGRQIAFAATTPDSGERKRRKEHLGDFDVVRRDYAHVHLWTIDVAAAFEAPQAGRQRTSGTGFSVSGGTWSPDGRRFAFSATRNPDLVQGHTSDIYVLDLADDSVRKIVDLAGPDSSPRWSPDGRQIVFVSSMGRSDFFHANRRLAVVPVEGGTPRSITDAFDEQPGLLEWRSDGVYFTGLQKTASHLFRVDPSTGRITRLSAPDDLIGSSFSLTRDGATAAFVRVSPTELGEVVVTPLAAFAPRRLTTMSDQLTRFVLGRREVITWKSTDGTPIEGVLVKPADFDASRKYPLLVVIHGGPTGIDLPHGRRHALLPD